MTSHKDHSSLTVDEVRAEIGRLLERPYRDPVTPSYGRSHVSGSCGTPISMNRHSLAVSTA
jgi:hypothetical protein